MKMSPEMFEKYAADPMGMDKVVRKHFKIPDDKYYSVAMMNDVGAVTLITSKKPRVEEPVKISKSDAQ